jgi:hypothetical protein
MPEPIPLGGRVRNFDDLAAMDDDFFRQLASRVHIVDLAYAFATADPQLRDRLFAAVSPRLKNEIESAMRTIEAQARPPSGSPFPEEQVRSARARVMEVAHGALLFDT